jgi:anti-sigma regulatory factor (Ser/Thr protein kinase)
MMSRTEVCTIERELPPVAESVAYARDLVVHSVAPALRHDVALIVSELVANAVRRGSGPIGLHVDVQDAAVRIAVRDSGVLSLRARGDGSGLHLVEQLATESGVDHDESGKTVWAMLERRVVAGSLTPLPQN